jgi:alpha-L-fucosidase
LVFEFNAIQAPEDLLQKYDALCYRFGVKSLFLASVTLFFCSSVLAQTKPSTDYSANVDRQVAKVRRQVAPGNDGLVQANWDSLGGYRTPDWFRDAKFGIFLHWGVYSVPAFGTEWYSRNMYVPGSEDFKHHVAVYGPQAAFGYKDFIPMFKGQSFDPQSWVDLFVRAEPATSCRSANIATALRCTTRG